MGKKKRYKGKIRWYDKYSKHGKIRLESGESVPFYGCNAIGAKSAYPELSCAYFKEGQEVTFELHEALGAVKVSGARIDEKEWTRRDGKNSMFQLDENGEFKNGMF